MPRKSIGDTPMTGAERQARCRTARASGVPVVHTRRTIDRRSRAQRWRDAVAKLTRLQAHHTAWLEALPSGVQESATAEALQAVCEHELTHLLVINLASVLSPLMTPAPPWP